MRDNDAFLGMLESLEIQKSPYCFGIGGLGDFLLLVSAIYDDCEDSNTPIKIVFVANSPKAIINMSKQFPLISLTVFPYSSFKPTKEMWDIIANNENCIHTGVTPENFEYVKSWQTCGHSDKTVFEYYNIKRYIRFLGYRDAKIAPLELINTVVIQPYGGKYTHLVTDMPISLVNKLIYEDYADKNIVLSVTQNEYLDLQKQGFKNKDTSRITFESDFGKLFTLFKYCVTFVGTDSWGKTAAALTGVPEIIMYKRRYPYASKIEMFGEDIDPTDYLFHIGWGFTVLETKDEY